jgi:hypothetical protein
VNERGKKPVFVRVFCWRGLIFHLDFSALPCLKNEAEKELSTACPQPCGQLPVDKSFQADASGLFPVDNNALAGGGKKIWLTVFTN